MSTIPKQKLSTKQRANISSLLGDVCTQSTRSKDILSILQELLAPTEYEALLRRLTAILLLDAGCSYYAVNKSLGLSVRTLRILDKKMKIGDLSQVLKTLRSLISYANNNKDRTRAGFKIKPKDIRKSKRGIMDVLPHYGEGVNRYLKRTSD